MIPKGYRDAIGSSRKGSVPEGIRAGVCPVDAVFLQAEGDDQLSLREEPDLAALPRRACAAPLPQRRGALHRLQAVRGDLSGPGDHHRSRAAPQRRDAPHHALRHRHGQMHLLRPVPGGLPGRCHRRGTELRVRDRDARGALLRQGAAARERRPVGTRDRPESRARCAVPVKRDATMILPAALLPAVFFWIFAVVCVASAAMVITARNPVHSVLFLILAFVNASGLFMLLGAEFLAMILIVVYVGAVAVLFLFVVMMLDVDFAELRQGFLNYLPIGLIIGTIFAAELVLVVTVHWAFGPEATNVVA